MKKNRRVNYHRWNSMKQRCYNPNNPMYQYYGARGIKVCDRWLNSFDDFSKDIGKPPHDWYSLDRIDNDGNYEPGNVRWATERLQKLNRPFLSSTNKSGYRGVSWNKSKAQWRVSISNYGCTFSGGHFTDKQEAAKAYNELAIRFHGKHARLNEV